MNAVGSKFY